MPVKSNKVKLPKLTANVTDHKVELYLKKKWILYCKIQ